MSSSQSSNSVPGTLSTLAARMALLSQIVMPKPTIPSTGPRTAYMHKKGRRSTPKSGAARIMAERRYVKGLGYIRADARPVRARSTRDSGSKFEFSSESQPAPVGAEDLEICSKLIAMSGPGLLDNVPGPSSGKMQGLYDEPRYPSTMTQSCYFFE